MRAHLEYLKLLGHHALRHADTSSNWMTVAGILLLAVGLGGVINGMAEVVPGGGIYTLAGFGGLYLVGKSVWDADQATISTFRARLDAHEAISPLRIVGTDHKGKWRRFIVENPNSFVVGGSYVAVEEYRSFQALDWGKYSLPERGFRFNWGTQQNNPNGNIGARDTLIIDIVEQRNTDHFTHAAPAEGMHKYTPFLPLPYGTYQIDLVLGATGAAVPVGRETIEIDFQADHLDVNKIALAARRMEAVEQITVFGMSERQAALLQDLNALIETGETIIQGYIDRQPAHALLYRWPGDAGRFVELIDPSMATDFHTVRAPKEERFKGVGLLEEEWKKVRKIAGQLEILRACRGTIELGLYR